MSQYGPSIDNLLATVRRFLDDLVPQLAGETRYKTQVASFLLGICEREILNGDANGKADRAAWAALLKETHGDTAQMARELCKRIRDGSFDENFDQLLDIILARTTDDARLVRPDYVNSATE